MKKMSVNVRNGKLSLKQWLVVTLKSFYNKNMTISGMNTEKLLMFLKSQTVMLQQLMFVMNITLNKFLTQNVVNI